MIIFTFLLWKEFPRDKHEEEDFSSASHRLHVYSDEFKEPLRGMSKLFGLNGQLHLLHPPSRRGSLREFPAEEDDSPGQRGGKSRRGPEQNIWERTDCSHLLRDSVVSR